MKCRACGKKAVISLRAHNTGFCRDDYLIWFRRNTLRTIKRFGMFGPNDRILLAVSGGKDSLALWHLLTREGFEADGLYIAQGIGNEKLPYSGRSEEACRQMAQQLGRPLRIVHVREKMGADVPDLRYIARRKICSVCGLAKRYLMNREAFEGGYTVLATGHNLDDEAAALFGNVMAWNMTRLAHQAPVAPQKGDRLMKKVKPLCFFTEREVLAYTLLERLPYMAEECPHSAGAKSITNKELLCQLEMQSPGSKRRFYTEFLRQKEAFVQAHPEPELSFCGRCGMPSTVELCVYCRVVQRVEEAGHPVVYRNLPQDGAQTPPEPQIVMID